MTMEGQRFAANTQGGQILQHPARAQLVEAPLAWAARQGRQQKLARVTFALSAGLPRQTRSGGEVLKVILDQMIEANRRELRFHSPEVTAGKPRKIKFHFFGILPFHAHSNPTVLSPRRPH